MFSNSRRLCTNQFRIVNAEVCKQQSHLKFFDRSKKYMELIIIIFVHPSNAKMDAFTFSLVHSYLLLCEPFYELHISIQFNCFHSFL